MVFVLWGRGQAAGRVFRRDWSGPNVCFAVIGRPICTLPSLWETRFAGMLSALSSPSSSSSPAIQHFVVSDSVS